MNNLILKALTAFYGQFRIICIKHLPATQFVNSPGRGEPYSRPNVWGFPNPSLDLTQKSITPHPNSLIGIKTRIYIVYIREYPFDKNGLLFYFHNPFKLNLRPYLWATVGFLPSLPLCKQYVF